jgi:LacI family transcriptional regulator
MLLFEKRSGYDAVLYETLTDVRDAPPPPQEVIVEEHLQHIDRFIRWRLDQPEASSRTIRFLPLADGSHGRWPEYLGAPAAKPDQRGVKRIALSDIAEAAGVAINTVSKALQGKPGVSEQNRLRLLTIANQLGYERIYTEKPMTLLVINEIQKHSYYLFNDFTERLRREARTQANRIEIVEITGNRTDNIENALSQINPDGLVLFFLSQTTLDWIQKHVTLPSVSVVSPAHGRMVDSVVEDHEAGMDRIVEHWYAQGYRKIGYVTHRPEDGKVSEIRYKAFRKSIESRGLPWAEDWAVTIPYTNVTEIEEYQLLSAELARLLNNSAAEHPEVIVCFNDQLAYNTQTVLSTIGRDNIKVSGWDRNPFMQNLLRFPTLETDLDALAFEAIQQLVRRMKHPLAPRCEVAVQSKLVVR